MPDMPIPFAPAIETASRILRGDGGAFTGKWIARTLIAGGRVLSVPVAGGASRLKTRNPESLSPLLISDHGRWRQEHLGAWNAAYGKTPYFPHIFPRLEKAYAEHSHGTLMEFNHAIFNIAAAMLGDMDTRLSLEGLRRDNPERLRELREYHATKVNMDYSIFDALFRLGKNTVWIC